MCCDAVSAGLLAQQCGGDRIRFIGAARLTKGGYVIDVDEQTLILCVHGSGGFRPGGVRPLIPRVGRHYVRIQTGLEKPVRKWLLLVIVAAGCGGNPRMGSSLTGAPSAR